MGMESTVATGLYISKCYIVFVLPTLTQRFLKIMKKSSVFDAGKNFLLQSSPKDYRGIYIGRQSGECSPKMFPRDKIWEMFAMWGTCLQLAENVRGRHVRWKNCFRGPIKNDLIPVSCLGDNINVSLQCKFKIE